jgi:hypothetical protein
MVATQAMAAVLPPDIPQVRWRPDPLYIEEGFRYGYILNFDSVLGWRFEGLMMVGEGSSPGSLLDQDCVTQATAAASSINSSEDKQAATNRINQDCLIDQNPWSFSSLNKKLYHDFKVPATPVVVYYVRTAPAMGLLEMLSVRTLWTNTDNYVEKIWRVGDQRFTPPQFFSIADRELPVVTHLNPAEGFLEGRVVKATINNPLRKTYEVDIQLSSSGSDFTRMSVDDSAMFDHLVLSMLSGRMMRFGFVRLFAFGEGWISTLMGYQTLYRITSIELLPQAK